MSVAVRNADSFKRAAAARALAFVESGMKIGLGTGTTAEAFLELLGEKVRAGLAVTGAATSLRTQARARALGIPVEELDRLAPLDLAIDGADEADRNLDLIKGGGGALLREKIVASSARRMIVIADDSKIAATLGRLPLPVEVTPFAHETTARRIAGCVGGLGYRNLRMRRRENFVTDGGNLIYDCAFETIADAPALAAALDAVPGLVEHGLFVGIASALVVAGDDGVRIIERPHSS